MTVDLRSNTSLSIGRRWGSTSTFLQTLLSSRLRVVYNFGDGDRGAGENTFFAFASRLSGISRALVFIFARPTIAIDKIRDYSQSTEQRREKVPDAIMSLCNKTSLLTRQGVADCKSISTRAMARQVR